MSILQIAWRSVAGHRFSSILTALGIALSTGLLLTVWVLKNSAEKAFVHSDAGFDAVLGARGSKLQLVLNAVFHLDDPVGNIPFAALQELTNNANVEAAYPLALGDNFKGYRVVGTLPELFTKHQYAPGQTYRVAQPGRVFDPTLREALVGSFAARTLNLKPGDEIHPSHGVTFHEGAEHDEDYVVVGILEPSNTPADKVIWIPLEGVQKMGGHTQKGEAEVSAVLVKIKAGAASAGFQLDLKYNKEDTRYTFAWPIGRTIAQLFSRIAWFDRILQWIAYLVAFIACGSVIAAIYNSINERRKEIAILRALGARRSTVFGTVVIESLIITGLGVIGGILVYATFMGAAFSVIQKETGVVINPLAFHPVLLIAPLGILALSALFAFIPAYKAYQIEVAQNL